MNVNRKPLHPPPLGVLTRQGYICAHIHVCTDTHTCMHMSMLTPLKNAGNVTFEVERERQHTYHMSERVFCMLRCV